MLQTNQNDAFDSIFSWRMLACKSAAKHVRKFDNEQKSQKQKHVDEIHFIDFDFSIIFVFIALSHSFQKWKIWMRCKRNATFNHFLRFYYPHYQIYIYFMNHRILAQFTIIKATECHGKRFNPVFDVQSTHTRTWYREYCTRKIVK